MAKFFTTLAFSILFATNAFAVQQLRINGPVRIGAQPNKPFMHLVPATGQAPLKYAASGLPAGLSIDASTGIISGTATNNGDFKVSLTVSDATGTATRDVTIVVDPKAVGLTPILGWNPWYVWGCQIDDKKIRQAADFMVSSGLAAHGYNYINLDDCWQGQRDANGVMVPNSRFPDMKALADYVHSKGLKIGIYTGPGPKTCAGYQGSNDHDFDKGAKSYLDIDVKTYADWGMDLVKYDWCIFPRDPAVKEYYFKKMPTLYKRMSEAIDRSSRSMVHMMCQYGEKDVWNWGESVGGQSWRTDHDLADDWRAILRAFGRVPVAIHQSAGHYNDLDFLMVGKGNWPEWKKYQIPNAPPRPTKLTLEEQKTHMSFWALMASPLIFSGDLTQLDPLTISLLTNDDMLAVNQDPAGHPVRNVQEVNGTLVLSRELADGSTAVGLFNLNSQPALIRVDYARLGLPPRSPLKIRNLWTKTEMESDKLAMQANVPAHGVYFLKLSVK